jgi:hypothetical protein
MSLFKCSRCDCVEDTALCHYWSARLQQAPPLCSACDPKIARWHGEFPRDSAEGWVTDARGFLKWSKSEVERWLGQPIDIVGTMASRARTSGFRSSGH